MPNFTPSSTTTRTSAYRPDLEILIVRWHQDAALPVLQADYQTMLEVAAEHNCARWLLDVRRREDTDPQLSAWASATFYPQAAAQLLPQRLHLAVLNSTYIYERFRNDPAHQQYVAYMLAPERPFLTKVFDDEGEATRWLQEA
ncbi:hypothetical protein SAMN00120144_3855 [Hymenobacter roseosalivarius DSM 11622]|uniref:STAS/SEC14 domain-containing protein n=1 Tax=Hymenobacter roseosalivarius DSM 11622 TaxID=645990 RepID=A0A1W1UUF9_9BACT|nr:hypothetical protein [Hymenobacter roseosalivarius]SMB84788.1 hypothetical protein SAMN00120144_3855 [Hymenobacter roseosalivarius DSM 11622]